MSSNTKRNHPYVKKENKKKTEAKNKFKGTIFIDALPMNDPDFWGKDNVPDTPMHDNFGGETTQVWYEWATIGCGLYETRTPYPS